MKMTEPMSEERLKAIEAHPIGVTGELCDEIRRLRKENEHWKEQAWRKADYAEELRNATLRLRRWVSDLHAGMYINCVYCGHRYGPDTEVPASMADVLKEHIEQCPEHPMSKLKEKVKKLRREIWFLKRRIL